MCFALTSILKTNGAKAAPSLLKTRKSANQLEKSPRNSTSSEVSRFPSAPQFSSWLGVFSRLSLASSSESSSNEVNCGGDPASYADPPPAKPAKSGLDTPPPDKPGGPGAKPSKLSKPPADPRGPPLDKGATPAAPAARGDLLPVAFSELLVTMVLNGSLPPPRSEPKSGGEVGCWERRLLSGRQLPWPPPGAATASKEWAPRDSSARRPARPMGWLLR
mmetsp:Transcript_3370/g.7807  ORF Transcript_3370/g.7807 Transcript_3370/m.7807 type:complete len:219 (+) Transcript_3370:62-718(+)